MANPSPSRLAILTSSLSPTTSPFLSIKVTLTPFNLREYDFAPATSQENSSLY